MILTKKYPENEEMTTEINSTAEYYYSMYEQYEQLTKAIKEYDIENNVFMILNLDRGPIC